MKKLKFHSTPTGTCVGNERVTKRRGTYRTHYEYCTVVETFLTTQSAAFKFGNMDKLEWAEKIFFNPGQGNRLSDNSAVIYLGADQQFHTFHGIAGRYRYAARHMAAACCPLNGGRLVPSYVRGMWARRSGENLPSAMLFGPCRLSIKYAFDKTNQQDVIIDENTGFPFDDTISFDMKTHAPEGFAFYVRKPTWATKVKIDVRNADVQEQDDFWKVIPEVGQKAAVKIRLNPQIEVKRLSRKGSLCERVGPDESLCKEKYCIKRGPLYFVLDIPHELKPIKNLQDSGFYVYKTKLKLKDYIKAKRMKLPKNPVQSFNVIKEDFDETDDVWANSPLKLKIKGDHALGDECKELVPMGCTRLRKFAFRLL